MFRATAILASLVSASAFAPSARVSTRSALQMGYENELGVTKPAGFWDPLGTLNNCICHEVSLAIYVIYYLLYIFCQGSLFA